MARFDGLTGAMNGRTFAESALTVFRLAGRYGHPLAIGYLDLDNFKIVNDSLGHSEGDHVLKTVATVLMKTVRESDLVGRMGGDEFAVLLPETSSAGALKAFENLRAAIMSEVRAHGWPIGVSIGVVAFRTAPASVEEAISLADALMYRVKSGGKNSILIEESGTGCGGVEVGKGRVVAGETICNVKG